MVGNTVVEVALADITAADVDVIVNSVCNYLHVGSGVSGAILDKAGPSALLPSREIASQTPVEAGTVLITDAGRLPYKHIFHAISSKCTDGTTVGELKTSYGKSIQKKKNLNKIFFNM